VKNEPLVALSKLAGVQFAIAKSNSDQAIHHRRQGWLDWFEASPAASRDGSQMVLAPFFP
jgi:hypothetical protein